MKKLNEFLSINQVYFIFDHKIFHQVSETLSESKLLKSLLILVKKFHVRDKLIFVTNFHLSDKFDEFSSYG